MAARRLWLVFSAELSAYALVILIVHARFGIDLVGLVAFLPLAALGLRVFIVVASFVFAASAQAQPRLDFLVWLHMLAAETLAFLRFQLLIAMHPRNDAALPAQDANVPLVVLLHGVYCNGAVWRPIVDDLRRRTGCTIRTPDLEPPTASLDAQALALGRWLQAIVDSDPPRPIIVVAHSLGGLMVRRYLMQEPHAGLRFVCIGTPHRGTLVARVLQAPIGRDLRPNSVALVQLERASPPRDAVNIYATHDNLVVPARSSELSGVRNCAVIGCGHMALIYSPEVRDLLCAEIDRLCDLGPASSATT